VAESDGYYRFQITSTASTGLTNLITQTVNKLMVRKNVLLNTIPEMEAKVNSLLQNLGNQNEVVNFRVTLNCYHSNNDANTVANQDSTYNLYDWGALFLPPNYTKAGTKTRLIIHCHGSGGVINSSTTEPTTILAKNLLKLGYAILEMNGIPDDIATTETAKGKHYGASYSLQSNVKGYQYVVKNYNIYKEVFVTGSSMGGLSSFELVQSGCIEVIAQGAFAPVVDNFKQAYCQPWETYLNQRYRMARYFNFPNFSTFSFTNTQYPSQSEIDYYMANYDKIIGYNPIHKNCVNWSSLNPYNTKNDTPANQTIEDGVYNQLVNLHPVPLKVWHCEDDATVSYRYAKHLVNAIKRGGGIAFYRPFPSGGHSAWDTGDNVNMTDVIGNPLTVKASTYELYQFFKRYELNVA
jgi:esterase/lipase